VRCSDKSYRLRGEDGGKRGRSDRGCPASFTKVTRRNVRRKKANGSEHAAGGNSFGKKAGENDRRAKGQHGEGCRHERHVRKMVTDKGRSAGMKGRT